MVGSGVNPAPKETKLPSSQGLELGVMENTHAKSLKVPLQIRTRLVSKLRYSFPLTPSLSKQSKDFARPN